MAAALTTITNTSKQIVPILVNAIASDKANANSDIAANVAQQMQIAPGAETTIETKRIDLGQLDQLRRKGLLTYTTS